MEKNLTDAALGAGVPARRLVFAKRVSRIEQHLARLQLADLFLDTAPYNAHTTGAEALWAGVPVITCRGQSFAGRVGASFSRHWAWRTARGADRTRCRAASSSG